MSPEDRRHGSRAGYIAGCREECCRVPHVRYQKRSTLRRLREGSQYVDPAPLRRHVDKWGTYGVSTHALGIAAGLAGSALGELVRGNYRPEKKTVRAVLAVTWEDLADTALVNADLTRARIYSLMAAGHPLGWICEQVDGLSVSGKWRTQERISLGLAREVQALYQTAPTWGPSRQTATKAQGKGHQTPAAWDDPELPAMPLGWRPERDIGSNHRRRSDIDHAVVERVLAGETLPTTKAEKDEITRRWMARGGTRRELAARFGWHEERYGKGDAA